MRKHYAMVLRAESRRTELHECANDNEPSEPAVVCEPLDTETKERLDDRAGDGGLIRNTISAQEYEQRRREARAQLRP